jgi:hypothetical protein
MVVWNAFQKAKITHYVEYHQMLDLLCGLVVRVPVYRSRASEYDSWHYQIFLVVGLERGPLSLVSTIEELLGRKSSSSGLENQEYHP